MSSEPSNQLACGHQASDMSCDAMSLLARDEARRNRGVLDFMTVSPVCERFQQLADRGAESDLQMTGGLSRKMCFEKTPAFQSGPWEAQFVPLAPGRANFDRWTRAKGKQ